MTLEGGRDVTLEGGRDVTLEGAHMAPRNRYPSTAHMTPRNRYPSTTFIENGPIYSEWGGSEIVSISMVGPCKKLLRSTGIKPKSKHSLR